MQSQLRPDECPTPEGFDDLYLLLNPDMRKQAFLLPSTIGSMGERKDEDSR